MCYSLYLWLGAFTKQAKSIHYLLRFEKILPFEKPQSEGNVWVKVWISIFSFCTENEILVVQRYCAMVFILITIENEKHSQKYPFHSYPVVAMLLETRPVVMKGSRKHVALQSTSIIF